MGIITLTSDLGIADPYLAITKGVIYSNLADAKVVDVSHTINKYDLVQAAFVVRRTYPAYPAGTVHLILVDSALNDKTAFVAVKAQDQYFIGNDNGMFSLIFDEFPAEAVELNLRDETLAMSFPGRSALAKAACHLANGGNIGFLGSKIDALNEKTTFKAARIKDQIKGHVVYIDSFGNLITNVSRTQFESVQQGRNFEIAFVNRMRNLERDSYAIRELKRTYSQVPQESIVAFFNSFDLLEIAVNMANAHRLLGIEKDEQITITFYDNENREDDFQEWGN